MENFIYQYGNFIIIILFAVVMLFIMKLVKVNNKCIDGGEHDWKFDSKNTGKTGDLGFGIRASWDIDYYRYSKCKQEKEVENY